MAKDLQFTFRRPCLELSGEIGSLAELIGYMQEESASLTLMFGDDMEMTVQRINHASGTETAIAAPAAEGTAEQSKPRGRPKKPPVEAVAPDPIAVPPPVIAAPPTVPVAPVRPDLAIPADGSIPPFLRNQAPPPPPIPAAPTPPLPSAPPPVGVLGPKVVKALDVLKEGKPDGGQALADWLAAAGLTIKGKTYDEATRAVLMISDEKITAAGVLEPLGIS